MLKVTKANPAQSVENFDEDEELSEEEPEVDYDANRSLWRRALSGSRKRSNAVREYLRRQRSVRLNEKHREAQFLKDVKKLQKPREDKISSSDEEERMLTRNQKHKRKLAEHWKMKKVLRFVLDNNDTNNESTEEGQTTHSEYVASTSEDDGPKRGVIHIRVKGPPDPALKERETTVLGYKSYSHTDSIDWQTFDRSRIQVRSDWARR